MSVDLPAPFSPQMACTCPAMTFRFTSRRARTGPNDLLIPRISRIAGRSVIRPVPAVGPHTAGFASSLPLNLYDTGVISDDAIIAACCQHPRTIGEVIL